MPVANRLYLAHAYCGSDRCTCARACSRSRETSKESISYPASARYRDTCNGSRFWRGRLAATSLTNRLRRLRRKNIFLEKLNLKAMPRNFVSRTVNDSLDRFSGKFARRVMGTILNFSEN